MATSWRVGTIRDIPIEVHPSWVITFFLVSFTLAVGLFPAALPDRSAALYWPMAVITALLFFSSVLVHELAHAFTALAHRIPIRRITLFIFGGLAQIGGEPKRPGVEFQVAIAGPLASLAIAAVGWAFAVLFTWFRWEPPAVVAAYLFRINLALALFNMVPAFPLDGGRVLRAILWWRMRDMDRATRVVSALGQAFAMLLMFFGITGLFAGQLIQGMWFAFIGWFLYQASLSGLQQTVLRETLGGVPVTHLMATQLVTVTADTTVQDLVDNYFYRYRYAAFPVFDDGNNVVGMVSLKEVRPVPRDQWPTVKVGDIAQPIGPEDCIDVGADAADALMRMAAGGRGRLLVTEQGRLVGLVSNTDVLRLIKIQQELRV